MESTHTASIDIPELSRAASITHVFPGMVNQSLLSVGKLCNEGYSVTFKIDTVTIHNLNGIQILRGARDLNTGLFRINLKQEHQHHSPEVANKIYELRNTGALVAHLHKAVFSPTKYALLQAFKNGHLITWSGLTEQAINKHLKMTPATTMGHMNQCRQNICSTSKASITSDIEDRAVTPAGLGSKTHLVYAVVIDQGQLYKDLTGKFLLRSRKGGWYVMICYSYECNYFKAVHKKSRSIAEWVKEYKHIHQELTSRGFKPKLQTLDNEASAALKSFSTTNDVEYQLVPPHCHRRNAAERAIRTFKEHFVPGLASVEPDFHSHLWYCLLPQAEMTLNSLRKSRQHLQLSPAAHYRVMVDYNKNALSPPGRKIIAHENPYQRRTWAHHGQHGYSVGPAMHHYRCQNVYISSTASEPIVDTLELCSPQLSNASVILK
jgi:hypothetical protein